MIRGDYNLCSNRPAASCTTQLNGLELRIGREGEIMAKILVADGEREAADVLAEALRLNGHAVRTCYSGKQCMMVAHEFRPDVVLLCKTGIDAEVAKQPKGPAAPSGN